MKSTQPAPVTGLDLYLRLRPGPHVSEGGPGPQRQRFPHLLRGGVAPQGSSIRAEMGTRSACSANRSRTCCDLAAVGVMETPFSRTANAQSTSMSTASP